jgi:hypothetical protein
VTLQIITFLTRKSSTGYCTSFYVAQEAKNAVS